MKLALEEVGSDQPERARVPIHEDIKTGVLSSAFLDPAGLANVLPAARAAAAILALTAPLPDEQSRVLLVDAWPTRGCYRITLTSSRNPVPSMHVWFWRIATCEFLAQRTDHCAATDHGTPRYDPRANRLGAGGDLHPPASRG